MSIVTSVNSAENTRVNPIYLLDFDGVICDSAVETAMTAWQAAHTLWDDMPSQNLPNSMIEAFRQVRPVLETGYEAILIIRLLYQGQTPDTICQHYQSAMQTLIVNEQLNIPQLKQLFGQTRDTWIKYHCDDWLANNPLFSGVAAQLRKLSQTAWQQEWYIITTKQERFVEQILKGQGIALADSHIFGMDHALSKQQVLQEMRRQHPDTALIFIEDRLQTLVNICENSALQSISLQLAKWGYNTVAEQKIAQQYPIKLIELSEFLHPVD
jgi:phosphoglycolate phosphatase-like HAD superfamily hydrolase